MPSSKTIKDANARAATLLAHTPTAISARYDRRQGLLVIELSTGIQLGVRPKDAEAIAEATATQLRTIEISPSGLGLHFPAMDADIYLPSLLEGFLGSRRWMAAQLGREGGAAPSKATSAAVRNHGKLGGRPSGAHGVDATV